MTNHSSLTNFFHQLNLDDSQELWTMFLKEFNFEIKHFKGKENWVVYALSQSLNFIYEIYFRKNKFDFSRKIEEVALKDPEYQFLWQQ